MRGTPIHYFKSLNGTFNVLGVERKLFYAIALICFVIAYSAHLKPVMDIIALGMFVVLHSLGVLITRIDSQIIEIYRRNIRYKKQYRPSPGVHAFIPMTKPSVPYYEGQRGFV